LISRYIRTRGKQAKKEANQKRCRIFELRKAIAVERQFHRSKLVGDFAKAKSRLF